MIRTILMGIVVAGAVLIESHAEAQTAGADTDDARYSYNRVDDGYLRLDTRSGDVSLCNRRAVGWSCEMLPDDRAALNGEVARLRGENAALKKALLDRGLALPSGTTAEGPAPQCLDEGLKQRNDAEFERVKALVGRVWRRLVDMFTNLQKEVMKKT